MKREEWYEMPSYSYAAKPGLEINVDCGHWWHCALESDPDTPHGLAVREWHNTECRVWADHDPEH
jgi:hypothetical protein